MISQGHDTLQILLAFAFMVGSGYLFGRLHQAYKNGLSFEQHYRTGYREASQSMLEMVNRPGPQQAEPKRS